MGIRTNGNSAFFRVFFGCYLFAYKWEFEQMGSKFQYFAWKKRNSRIMKNNKNLKFENLQLSKKRNQTVSLFPWCQLEVFLHEGNSWNWNIAEIWSFEVKLQFRFPKKREISSLEETKFETGIRCFCCFWTKNRWVLLQQTRFLCFYTKRSWPHISRKLFYSQYSDQWLKSRRDLSQSDKKIWKTAS